MAVCGFVGMPLHYCVACLQLLSKPDVDACACVGAAFKNAFLTCVLQRATVGALGGMLTAMGLRWEG